MNVTDTASNAASLLVRLAVTGVVKFSVKKGGEITTGTWNGSVIGLAYGGTNANLTASNGGIFYSTATGGAILTGTATAGLALISGASAAPTWYVPTTGRIIYTTTGGALISDASLTHNGSVMVLTSTSNGANFTISSNQNNAGIVLQNTKAGGKTFEFDATATASSLASSLTLYDGTRYNLVINNSGDVFIGGAITTTTGTGAAGKFYAAGTVTLGTTTISQVVAPLIIGAAATIFSEKLSVQANANALTELIISNTTAGTAAQSGFRVLTDGGIGVILRALSSTYTTSGIKVQSASSIESDQLAGMNIGTTSNTQLSFWTNNTKRAAMPAAGGFVIGIAALATNATDGFLYIPTCAGTPTGVPTAQTGTVAMIFDTTNNKLYIYDGSWLGGTTPGAFT